MRKLGLVVPVLFAGLLALEARATQVLVNGGFEAGGQGWTIGQEATVCDDADPACGSGSAHGTHYLWLQNTVAGNFAWAQQSLTVPAGRLLQFRRWKYTCAAGTFRVTFTPAGGGTVTLFDDSTATGCPALYETFRVPLTGLGGQSGVLRFLLAPSGVAQPHVLVDDIALVPRVIKGDFNLDRAADLLFAQPSQPAGCEAHDVWNMIEGARISFTPVTTTCLGGVRGVDDFDGDGDNDVAVVDSVGFAWVYYLPPGLTGLSQVLGPMLGPDFILAATGDFNDDGHPDLLWRNTATQKLQIWALDGAANYMSTIVPTPDQAVDANWSVVAALDIDDDGARDLLWYNSSSGKIVWWRMDANMVRITGAFTNPPNAGDNNWKVVAAGDYGFGSSNGLEHTTDIVWRNENSQNLVIWFMDLAGNRTSGAFTSPAASPSGWTVAGPR